MKELSARLKALLAFDEYARAFITSGLSAKGYDGDKQFSPGYDGARFEHARTKALTEAMVECVEVIAMVVREMSTSGIQSIDPSEPERQMYDAFMANLTNLTQAVEKIEGRRNEINIRSPFIRWHME